MHTCIGPTKSDPLYIPRAKEQKQRGDKRIGGWQKIHHYMKHALLVFGNQAAVLAIGKHDNDSLFLHLPYFTSIVFSELLNHYPPYFQCKIQCYQIISYMIRESFYKKGQIMLLLTILQPIW